MGVGQRGRPLSFYWSIEMFKFIERFVTRIVSNAITPDLLVRAVSRDTLVEALNSNGMRALIVDEMLDSLDVKHVASCIDMTMLEEELAKRLSCREIARNIDHNAIIDELDISEHDVVELTVERLAGECDVYPEDVVAEAAKQWHKRNDLETADIVKQVIIAAYRGL